VLPGVRWSEFYITRVGVGVNSALRYLHFLDLILVTAQLRDLFRLVFVDPEAETA